MLSENLISRLKSDQCLYYSPQQAIISLQGPDSQLFLQKLTTNNLDLLKKFSPIGTCVVDNRGKLIDFLILFKNNNINIISSHENPNIILNFLEQYHFTENLIITENKTLKLNYIITSKDLDQSYNFKLTQQVSTNNINIFLSIQNNNIYNLISQQEFDFLRVACALPTAPNEINPNFMPQSIGLQKYINYDKGCYLGQEVLAKARTYQKNPKKLYGLNFTKHNFEKLQQENNLVKCENLVGQVSSLTNYWHPGLIHALAIMSPKKAPKPEELIIPAEKICCLE